MFKKSFKIIFIGKISNALCHDRIDSNKYIPSAFQINSLKQSLLNFGSGNFVRSNYQLDFFLNVIFTNSNIFAVQPTGTGKSLAFLLYAKIHLSSLILVIVPLISLINDLVRRSRHAMINCVSAMEDILPDTRIVFLTPENFIQDSTVHQIHRLSELGTISKIFIDECHFAVIDRDFRTSYNRVASICKNLNPVILLTGSASLSTEQDLKQLFFSNIASVVTLRQPTLRKNIEYIIKEINGGDKSMDFLNQFILDLKNDERIIIYTVTIEKLHEIYNFLGSCMATKFYSDLSDEEKNVNTENWFRGNTKTIIATKAFGVGIDFNKVKTVFHFGLPDSLEEYIQQAGRAGRNLEMTAKSVLLLDSAFEKKKFKYLETGSDTVRFDHFKKIFYYSMKTSTCRRLLLSSHFDSIFAICSVDDAKCDICKKEQVNNRNSTDKSFISNIDNKISQSSQILSGLKTPTKMLENSDLKCKMPQLGKVIEYESPKTFNIISVSPLTLKLSNRKFFFQQLKDRLNFVIRLKL